MSATNSFETSILDLVFKNVAFAGIADALGVAGSLFVSLHTADPGEAGTQLTSEATYTPYARITIARSGAGWTVASGVANPAANIDFAECTVGTEVITHAGIGAVTSGAGALHFKGALSASITMAAGVIPRVKSTSTITAD